MESEYNLENSTARIKLSAFVFYIVIMLIRVVGNYCGIFFHENAYFGSLL